MNKVWTIEELATDAFEKSEHVRNLEMMNTPIDYDARKKAFVELAVAQAEARGANMRLLAVRSGHKLEAPE
jgi:hypothetical protein